MAIKSTYSQTIRRNGKTYCYVARSYGQTAIQRGAGRQVLKDEAKREREMGNETIIVKKWDVNDWIYYLYSRPKDKRKRK